MALFDSVPKSLYDQLEGRYDALLEKYSQLVKQVIEIKRHEHGMNPENFVAESLMPEYGLGPKTVAACDEFSSGDPELRRYLVSVANKEYKKRSDMDPDDRDAQVAKIIASGDQG